MCSCGGRISFNDVSDHVHLSHNQGKGEALSQGWGPHDPRALAVVVEIAKDGQ